MSRMDAGGPFPVGLPEWSDPVSGTMIDGMLPSGAVAAEAFGDTDGVLFPEEKALVSTAVPARRREFATARECARRALVRLGLPPVAVPAEPCRAPRWPEGVVGSITHCPGYRAAVVAPARGIHLLGLDAEPNAPLPDGVASLVAGRGERVQLRALAERQPEVCWDRLLFSAKESVYKAWHLRTGEWLDFADAKVIFGPAAGAFSAELRADAGSRPARLSGRWLLRRGLLVTLTDRIGPDPADGAQGTPAELPTLAVRLHLSTRHKCSIRACGVLSHRAENAHHGDAE